jgi:hypothetical protein
LDQLEQSDSEAQGWPAVAIAAERERVADRKAWQDRLAARVIELLDAGKRWAELGTELNAAGPDFAPRHAERWTTSNAYVQLRPFVNQAERAQGHAA